MKDSLKNNAGFPALLTKILCVSWVVWVVLEYLIHHPYYSEAVTKIPYLKTISLLVVAGLGMSYFVYTKLQAKPSKAFTFHFRGLTLYLVFQLLSLLILGSFVAIAYIPEIPLVTRLGYFFAVSSAYLLAFFVIIAAAFAAGQLVGKALLKRYLHSQPLLSIALGLSILASILIILGQFRLLSPTILWAVVAGFMVLQYKEVGQLVYDFTWKKRSLRIHKWWTPMLYVLLLSVLAINFIGAFKTFPIGYDGTALYLNKTELIAQSGQLPAGGQAFAWSVLMSLGQILFDSRTMAILFSHLMNIFCLFALYRIARIWLQPAYALLAVLVPLTSPYFAYHGLVDEKIDLGFTFIVLSSLLLLLKPLKEEWLLQSEAKEHLSILGGKIQMAPGTYALLLAAWLGGFAFSIKYTAIFYLVALACLLAYYAGRRLAFAAMTLFSLGMLFVLKIHRFGYLDISDSTALTMGIGLSLLGIGLLTYYFRNKQSALRRFSIQMACLLGMSILAYAPWAVKHLSEHKSIGVQQLIEGKENSPLIKVNKLKQLGMEVRPAPQTNPLAKLIKGERTAEKSKRQGENASQQAAKEEIQRYLGYEPTFWRYVSLPYDISTNTNIPGMRYLDIGYLLLALLPLLLFVAPGRSRPIAWQLSLALAVIVYIALVKLSVFAPDGKALDITGAIANRSNFLKQFTGEESSILFQLYTLMLKPLLGLAQLLSPVYKAGKALGMPGIILTALAFCGGSYWLLKERLAQQPKTYKALGGFLMVYALLWALLGNGIIWYAMPMFVLLPILFVWPLNKPEAFMGNSHRSFASWFLGGTLGLALLLNGLTYFTSCFPGDQNLNPIFRWPFVDYVSNPNASEEDILRSFNPVIPDIVKVVNQDLSQKVYRVNTHFGFHIAANDTRVFSDPVLEKFDQVSNQFEDGSQFFSVLKANGFKYILFDLRTGNADKSPEQSLRKKFISMADLLIGSNKVRLLLTDNYVAQPNAPVVKLPNGKRANATQALVGQTIYLGHVALFEIL
ncbi:MAG: hypothetical protein AAF990_22205 [Bacteroidota bacterium]